MNFKILYNYSRRVEFIRQTIRQLMPLHEFEIFENNIIKNYYQLLNTVLKISIEKYKFYQRL